MQLPRIDQSDTYTLGRLGRRLSDSNDLNAWLHCWLSRVRKLNVGAIIPAVLRPITAALVLLLLTSCAAIVPHVSCSRPNAAADKRLLLYGDKNSGVAPAFDRHVVTAGGREWIVYTPAGQLSNPEAPPVLLLHELPALSPDSLDLARRIACNGFRVYVPLLFGAEGENPKNPFLVLRGATFGASPRWRALSADVDRPVVGEIAALCREYIRPLHPRQRLGVVGLCLTGGFPLALLGQDPPVPGFAAPVLSQPSVPFGFTAAQKASLGISSPELKRVQSRLRSEKTLEILGFRFEEDGVSPGERFETLKRELGDQFVNATLYTKDYHYRDGLPKRAHAVLTDGYRPWRPGQVEPTGHYAHRELIAFLTAKLKGSEPRRFERPPFDRSTTSPISSDCDDYGARPCPRDHPHSAPAHSERDTHAACARVEGSRRE